MFNSHCNILKCYFPILTPYSTTQCIYMDPRKHPAGPTWASDSARVQARCCRDVWSRPGQLKHLKNQRKINQEPSNNCSTLGQSKITVENDPLQMISLSKGHLARQAAEPHPGLGEPPSHCALQALPPQRGTSRQEPPEVPTSFPAKLARWVKSLYP